MKLSPISSTFNCKNIIKHISNQQRIWIPSYANINPNKYHDYTNELKIQLTNTIYNARKGIGEHSIKGYAYVAKFFNIKNLITLGGESATFSLKDGNILKLSVNKYSKYMPELHAPEISRGFIKTHEKYNIFDFFKNKETDTFYYVIQKTGQIGVSEHDEKELINKVRNAGYDLYDLKWDQIAYFDIDGEQQARFVDLGCIVLKDQGG